MTSTSLWDAACRQGMLCVHLCYLPGPWPWFVLESFSYSCTTKHQSSPCPRLCCESRVGGEWEQKASAVKNNCLLSQKGWHLQSVQRSDTQEPRFSPLREKELLNSLGISFGRGRISSLCVYTTLDTRRDLNSPSCVHVPPFPAPRSFLLLRLLPKPGAALAKKKQKKRFCWSSW